MEQFLDRLAQVHQTRIRDTDRQRTLAAQQLGIQQPQKIGLAELQARGGDLP